MHTLRRPAVQDAAIGVALAGLGVTQLVEMLGGTLRHATRDGRFELEALVPVGGTAR